MKHLLTLAVLLVSTLSLAQFTPYNPDADNDQFVGAQDLLAFLPLFGEDWDLDSLNIYALSELEIPPQCPENGWCSGALLIPQDADIIYYDDLPYDDESEQYLYVGRFFLPPVPKPLLFFGFRDWSDIQEISAEPHTRSWSPYAPHQYAPTNRFHMLIPFNGEYFRFGDS